MAARISHAHDDLSCPRLRPELDLECEDFTCNEELWTIAKEDYVGCPVKLVTQQSGEFFRAYRFYKNHLYPRAGGFLDQGNRYIEAMETIDKEINQIAKEEAQAREKK